MICRFLIALAGIQECQKGPEALDEFRLVISFCISTAETWKSIKLFACEGPRKSRGSIST